VRELNLNFELALSKVERNRRRIALHRKSGWKPSAETETLHGLSEELLHDARKAGRDEAKKGDLSQRSLTQALRAGEKIELEKAAFDIARRGFRPDFLIGCDARGMYEMKPEIFFERFSKLFNFATITFVPISDSAFENFEPEPGAYQYAMRDHLLKKLEDHRIRAEGRLLFWFHECCTPAWQKNMSYAQLLKHVERTTTEVLKHYGDRMYAWEIVNELHDWANELRLTPDQTIELTRLACDVAKAVAPKVERMINNCCPFAEYVQLKKWCSQDALYAQRTPVKFIQALADAGVDFTIIGQQMYFPFRDLQDTVLLLERYEKFGRKVQVSEIGASSGPTDETVKLAKLGIPKEPFVWHRPWDEELQADWLEGIFTLAYSKPWIEGANWFDFADPYHFIENGGLLRSVEGETKAAFDRLLALRERWSTLPHPKGM
jgi:endo-1,4-beta-xylanase